MKRGRIIHGLSYRIEARVHVWQLFQKYSSQHTTNCQHSKINPHDVSLLNTDCVSEDGLRGYIRLYSAIRNPIPCDAFDSGSLSIRQVPMTVTVLFKVNVYPNLKLHGPNAENTDYLTLLMNDMYCRHENIIVIKTV